MSGVTCADACVEAYNDMKMHKQDHRFITFKIQDKKQIVVDIKEPDMSKTWQAIKEALPDSEPRYAVMDVDYTTDDGRAQSKLTFVFWSPDDKTTVKDRMLYASSKDAIKKKLTGIMKELQANDFDDLSEADVNKLMNQK
mmetsp:Transcript_66144/g.148627  ORF Transcript_66144/g.148627 Transcript_66144/m.148627 type:complete len:140 (+) Transcript_66144:105-524(+)